MYSFGIPQAQILSGMTIENNDPFYANGGPIRFTRKRIKNANTRGTDYISGTLAAMLDLENAAAQSTMLNSHILLQNHIRLISLLIRRMFFITPRGASVFWFLVYNIFGIL